MARPFQFLVAHWWVAIFCLKMLLKVTNEQALNEDYLPESDLKSMVLTNEAVEAGKLGGSFEPKNYGLFSYVTGNRSASRAIVYLYDRGGFSKNNLESADALAADGSLFVVMPDVEGFKAFSESTPISANRGKYVVCFATKRCKEKEPCSWTCPECACRLWGGGKTRAPKPTARTTPKAPPPPAPPTPAPSTAECACTCEGDPDFSWVPEKCPAPQGTKSRALVRESSSEPVCGPEDAIESVPIQEIVEQVVQSLEKTAGKSVGIFGNEGGASYAVQVAAFTDGMFKAGAIVNPEGDVEDRSACVVKIPFFTAWAGPEAEHSQFYAGLLEKFPEESLGKEVYPNLKPNFFGSKGDRSDGENRKAIDDLVSKLKDYFLKQL